jgi:ring-1,2-phenylacetyl-CoA epoxidase subunit PaaD
MSTGDVSVKQAWGILEGVPDPEIPVVSIVELGIVREIRSNDQLMVVSITPTFAGCPALMAIKDQIIETLQISGVPNVEVEVALNPAWTTDWLSAETREKLRQFGLAPPPVHKGEIELILIEEADCPYCGSSETNLKNNFGPTLCRAIYFCNACQQPFEQFKAL